MARSKDLKVTIVGDADKLDRELKRSSNSLDKFGKQTKLTASVTSKGFSGMRAAATGATAGLAGLVLVGKKVVDAAIESEKSQAALEAQLKAMGISYKAHAKEIDAVIQKHSQLAGVDDEELADSFTTLVRSTGSVNTAMKDLGLVTDLARAKNIDVAKAATMVAKVHAGAVIPLKQMGIEFVKTTVNVDKLKASHDKITPAQLAAAKAADKQANSQRALGLVQDAVKGQAEAYGKTTAGSVDRANVAFENLQETVGDALAPSVEKAANRVADFVNEMQDGTGQGGRFVRKLQDMWQEVRPIVTWFGRAARNIANFTSEHPGVAKLASAIIGVGLAVKGLKFVSAATGFTSLLKAGRVAASGLKRVMARGGLAAGEAAAENAAAGIGTKSGVVAVAGRKAGTRVGKALAKGALLAIPLLIWEFKDQINSLGAWFSKSKIGSILTAPGKLGGKIGDALGSLFGTKRATGGIIPGTGNTDTVPAMLTPGEFVIRKRVVEKFGPTFFAGLNGGTGDSQGNAQVQGFTSGGIVARANKISGMNIPYVYGGGHGTRDGFNRSGMDCSASVSYALGVTPRVSGQFTSFGRPGPGSPNDTKVYATAKHVFAVFNGKGWGTSRENPGGGPGWLSYNHRSGFVIRHLEDGAQKGKGGVGSTGDPEETAEAGKQRKADARDRRRARAERAGSRAVNKIMGAAARGISSATSAAAGLATTIEDAGTSYGHAERRFGQTEEDLGTPQGRAERISELKYLAQMKAKTLSNQRKRAQMLKRAVSKLETALRKLRKARDRSKGAKRAKMNERMKPIVERLDDLKAELKALGTDIKDTELDIGDLAKEAGEVAGTPDTVVEAPEPDTRAVDKLGTFLGDIDLQERAGILSPAQAKAMRIQALQMALAGVGGPLDDRQRWEIMGQLREATESQSEAVVDNTSALRDLQGSIDAQLAFANGVSAITSMEAVRAMADVMSGQLGYKTGVRALMPGSGALSRL